MSIQNVKKQWIFYSSLQTNKVFGKNWKKGFYSGMRIDQNWTLKKLDVTLEISQLKVQENCIGLVKY